MGRCCSIALAFTGLFAAAVGAEEPVTKSVVYKAVKQGDKQVELSLKAFLPKDWKASAQSPAVVFFFGGGWSGGTPTQFEPQAQHLAERGMVAFCADYRVKSRHGVSPEACVEDAKSAVRYVRKHAATWGVDPNRIVSAGGSAGGHLAACTALAPGLEASNEDLAISSKPNLLVLYNPVLDFSPPELAGRVSHDPALVKTISPTAHLAKDSPPALLFFGKEDRLLVQGEAFMARSKELGHRAEMFLADGVGHGFFNRSPWRDKTTQRLDEFLVAAGYLSAPAGP